MSRSKLVPSLFLVAAGLGMAACVDDGDATVLIIQNQAPDAECVVAGSPTESFVSAGVIDASSNRGYVFTPVVQNFATAIEGQEQLRIAFVEGARVEIAFVEDPELFTATELAAFRTEGLTRFSVPMSGPIDPGATSSFKFEIVPPELLAEIAPLLDPNDLASDSTLLQVSVRLYGSLSGGGFETQVFRYPVDVCLGCLSNDLGACSSLSTDFTPTNTGGSCNAAQDEPVDCCVNGATLVCPAVGTMPPA